MPAALLSLVLIIFAAARVTRVLTDDKIGQPFRDAVRARFHREDPATRGEASMVVYLVYCRWCTGLWVSVPAAAVAWWGTPLGDAARLSWWWGLPATALAISYSIGLLVRAEPED